MTDIISPLVDFIKTGADTVQFYFTQTEKLKKLSGYQSGKHFIPKYYSKSLQDFVNNIAKDDIETSMYEISDKLREALKLGVNDFQFEVNPAEGGVFECKGLSYHSQCKPDQENLTDVIFTSILTIHLPLMYPVNYIFSAFPFEFIHATLNLPKGIDLKEFINQLETHNRNNPSDIVYYYDPYIQYLDITSSLSGRHIVVHADHLDIYFSNGYSALDLLGKWE